jgi:hypothetical protein
VAAQPLLAHAEAVLTFRVDVQLRRDADALLGQVHPHAERASLEAFEAAMDERTEGLDDVPQNHRLRQ